MTGKLVVMLLPSAVLPGGAVAQMPSPPVTTGTIAGRVVTAYVEKGVPKASVYLLTLDQSKPLRAREERAYKRAHQQGMDPDQVGTVEQNDLDELAAILPKLSHVAIAKSNTDGAYAFKGVPSRKPYYVAALKVKEDGVFYAAKATRVLKDGETLKLDLRDDAPWEERFRVGWRGGAKARHVPGIQIGSVGSLGYSTGPHVQVQRSAQDALTGPYLQPCTPWRGRPMRPSTSVILLMALLLSFTTCIPRSLAGEQKARVALTRFSRSAASRRLVLFSVLLPDRDKDRLNCMSRLRPPFLYDRYFFVTACLLKTGRWPYDPHPELHKSSG